MTEFPVKTRKKLIEVALPLEAINIASAREKSIRHGHPSTLHIWWARRPLAAARAVLFAQLVDDPSSHPDLFPTEKIQEKERKRLFKIIENLVLWENITNEEVLDRARAEIWQSWRSTCADNADHPRAKELFDRYKLPAFHDPFAGGGSIPLEAQRIGLESYASDLNPVAVLINKSMIEVPSKFAGREPVNPDWHNLTAEEKAARTWKGAQGLAEDVRYYGQWMRDHAEKRIGDLYPEVKIDSEIVKDRPDLQRYLGQRLNVIAWLWARTVKSPNPAFRNVDVPLVSTFMLSTKPGKEAYVEPLIRQDGYEFSVKLGTPVSLRARNGTKAGKSGSSFVCLMSGVPITFEYLRSEAKSGRMGSRLMAVSVEGDFGRTFVKTTHAMEALANSAVPEDAPDAELPKKALGFRVQEYGMTRWRDLFTARQLVALTTFSNLVSEARERVTRDAISCGILDDGRPLSGGGALARGYGDAVSVYLAFAVDYAANYWSTIATPAEGFIRGTFARQAIPMTWDYAEAPPFGRTSGNWTGGIDWISKALEAFPAQRAGFAEQADAATQSLSLDRLVSTDPPYYDNIGYADLSDFFYVWMRRSLKHVFPDLFATLSVPKAQELVATPFRHGGKANAEDFFLSGMTEAMHRLAQQVHPALPITIYYAFKQSETESSGTASTGWETFLGAVTRAGLALVGTWPMRTERGARSTGIGTNALASSIILVCRARAADAVAATRREFVSVLKSELPKAVAHLQRSNIAPVDLAQSAIGPGMATYTSYSKVVDAEGATVTVRQALLIINEVLDEVLAEQEGDFDPDTRWALVWFDQYGFAEGDYGVAETLSKAKNTSVTGMVDAGIIASKAGKVRLLAPEELSPAWDPRTDIRLTAWEIVHQLIRTIEISEPAAAELVVKLGSKSEAARELAYRLYNLSDRKKRAADALRYNSLVQSWPEILRLARQTPAAAAQPALFEELL